MPSTGSSAVTKCIAEVPGLVKQTLTPPATKVLTRLSAPIIARSPRHSGLESNSAPDRPRHGKRDPATRRRTTARGCLESESRVDSHDFDPARPDERPITGVTPRFISDLVAHRIHH